MLHDQDGSSSIVRILLMASLDQVERAERDSAQSSAIASVLLRVFYELLGFGLRVS